MDPSGFENRHSLLHPQQGFAALDLGEQEPGPAAVSRVAGEQLGKGGPQRPG